MRIRYNLGKRSNELGPSEKEGRSAKNQNRNDQKRLIEDQTADLNLGWRNKSNREAEQTDSEP